MTVRTITMSGTIQAIMKKKWVFVSLVTLTILPNTAFAHLVSTRFGEFYGGLMHPLAALAHVVPWLAIGLLAGLQRQATARWALLVFPLSVGTGSLLGSWLPEFSLIQSLNLSSFVVCGLLVALALPLRKILFICLTVLFGLSHGYANGAAELQGSDRLLYICGVAVAAYLLITLVTAGVQALNQRQQWGEIAVRAGGSWIVAVGLLFGGYTLLIASGV